MTTLKPSTEQKDLAKALDVLSVRLGNAYRPVNDNEHKFERTGWLMLRAAVQMIGSGDKAYSLASDWAARGFPAGTGGEPGGGGAQWHIDADRHGGEENIDVTSTEAASMQSDEWERRRDQLALLRRLLDDNASDVESQITDTIRVRPNEGRRDSLIPCGNPRTDAAGELVCTNRVTGFGEDRLKDGRCPRCYMFRWRTGLEWNPRLDLAAIIESAS